MNAAFISTCLEHPETLSKETLDTLEGLTKAYPWSIPVRMLYLRNLLNLNLLNKEEVARTALFLPDCDILHTLLETPAPLSTKKEETSAEKDAKSSNADQFSLINYFLDNKEEVEQQGVERLYEMGAASDYLSWFKTETEDNVDSSKGTKAEEETPRLQHQDLIDDFLSNDSPMGSCRFVAQSNDLTLPTETDNDLNDTNASETSEEAYPTESMARIYIKQSRYEQALQIIRKLHLKNPKKNTYFADQIKFLEKLITNTQK